MSSDFLAAGVEAGNAVDTPFANTNLPFSQDGAPLRPVEGQVLFDNTKATQSAEELAWGRVKEKLRTQLGEHVYSSWFASMDYEGLTDGTARLSVPTRFLKQWISSNYRDKVLAAWEGEKLDVRRLDISVRGATRCIVPPAGEARAAMIAQSTQRAERGVGFGTPTPHTSNDQPIHAPINIPARDMSDEGLGSPLDKRFTFDTFFVGRANSLAFAAAKQVSGSRVGEPINFNPLVVHSSVGQGKTHLLHAIAHEARTLGRRALYLTAERFMYGFVAAIKAQSAIQFKENLRNIHVLLIDDLQFLQGKHVQAEFGHTLNALLDGSRQVVVAADRSPSDLESLDERMRSRLAGGLAVELGMPEEDIRCKILRAKAELLRERYPNFVLPENVISYVAHAITTNGRDLDGALNRLVAHNQLTHSALTVEMAEDVIRDLVRQSEPKRVKIEDIQRIVAKHYNVQRPDLLSNRRTHNVVMPRQIAMYLAKVLTPRSLPEIGRRFGGRDHTTVLHAVRKIEEMLKGNPQLEQDIELLRRLLLET